MGGNRTCPDDCPLAVWANLSPTDRKTQRKPVAERLYKQGFTMEQIATQLGVNHGTISRDLREFVHHAQIKKPAKTPGNPKGAGRPKGTRKPGVVQKQRSINAKPEDWQRFKEIAEAEGKTAAEKLGEIVAEPEIDRADLAMTAQQKLDAAIRQHKRKLDEEFEVRTREECKRWLNEISLPQYLKELTKLEQSISNRKGIMDRITYRKILSCLHPDRVQDPILKKRYEEAFRLFTELEKRVLDEKESPTQFRKMPRTYEELMAMRAKVQAERRAKRNSKSTVAYR
jgi:hypothetical protein